MTCSAPSMFLRRGIRGSWISATTLIPLFLRIPKNSNGDIHDVAVIIDIFEKQCYIMDQKGKLLNKIPLMAFTENPNFQFYAEGDFTGYQYLRKFESSGSYFSWKFKL